MKKSVLLAVGVSLLLLPGSGRSQESVAVRAAENKRLVVEMERSYVRSVRAGAAMERRLDAGTAEERRRFAERVREGTRRLKEIMDPDGLHEALEELRSTLSLASWAAQTGDARRLEQALAVLRELEEPPAPAARESETAAKGSLGAVRSALSIFYGDTEGTYPADLAALVKDGKYLRTIPEVSVAGHARTSEVRVLRAAKDQADLDSQLQDSGKWLYVADEDSPLFGQVQIDCTHTDSRGERWSGY